MTNCPTCGAKAHVHGTSTTERPRYRCTSNPPHYFSESTGRSAGRPPIDNPSPAAIKKREQRAKSKEGKPMTNPTYNHPSAPVCPDCNGRKALIGTRDDWTLVFVCTTCDDDWQ